MQVGCPEARIDENVAKLTAAGYKVSMRHMMRISMDLQYHEHTRTSICHLPVTSWAVHAT